MDIKKIQTKEEHLKKTKRRNLLIGIVLVLIMVFGTAGYAVDVAFSNKGTTSTNSEVKYKGVDFVKDSNDYWEFQYNSMTFITKYNPLEVNDTKVSTLGIYMGNYNSQVLSFAWNDSTEGVYELDRNFEGNKIPLRVVQKACLTKDCPGDYPVKNCSVDNVIVFQNPLNNEPERVYTQDNCVFIVANETDQPKYADAFLFNMLGLN